MARLGKPELLEKIIRAVRECGWNVLILSNQHPFILKLIGSEKSLTVRVYIWNLTHGGGVRRPASEYRIQVTGIDNEAGFVEENFHGERIDNVLILGWWNEGSVFAGFDYHHHAGRLGNSPSIQIREAALRRAVLERVGTTDKGNKEIAIAFRPDFLIEYVCGLKDLHGFGESSFDLNLLEQVIDAPDLTNNEILSQVTLKRRVIALKNH